jgi:hypothetical protein
MEPVPTNVYISMTSALQNRLSIRWASDPSRHIQHHTGEKECILVELFTLLCELAGIKQFSDR